MLATMRNRMGLSREDVAAALRIRAPYLQAMEESRFHDLPGAAYASGFVRGYAEYLGMDGGEMVRRFKMESGEKFNKDPLSNMPSVPSEERIPRGAVIFIALILAVVSYVGWQYSVSEDKSVVEMIESIPTRVMEFVADVVNSGDTEQKPETPSSSEQLPPSSSTSTSPSSSQLATSQEGGSPSSSEASTSLAMGSATTPSAPAATTSEPAAASTAHETTPAPAPEATTPAPSSFASTPEAAPAAATAAPVVVATPTPPVQPEVNFGKDNTGGRVVVRATNTRVWMRVSEGNQVVFERTLNPGESYLVPNRSGLKLRTGNAKGTELLVDGKVIGSLGPAGAVRRDIILDPDALLALNSAQ